MPKVVYTSVGSSTVSVFPSTIENDGVATSYIVTTVLNSDGNPMPGLPVTLAIVSGTATLTQPASVTDQNGQATGSLVSSTIGTVTVKATVTGVDITQQVSVTVTVTPVAAWYTQEWDYVDTAAMKAAAYAVNENSGGTVALQTSDVSGGLSSVNKAMRATYPGDGTGATAGVDLLSPNYNVTKPRELWIETMLRFNDSWVTDSDDKTFFVLEDHSDAGGSSETGRWETHIVSLTRWYGGPSGRVGTFTPDFRYNNSVTVDPWDGSWHALRHHVKMSSTPSATDGIYKVWWDGALVLDWENIATNSPTLAFFRNIALGRNADPSGSGVRDWGRVLLYTSDPGWEA